MTEKGDRIQLVPLALLDDQREGVFDSETVSPMGYRLTFTEPVEGPLSLGASSHFGMGRFLPGGEA